MITFLRAHKHVTTFSLVAFCAFWLTPSWAEVGPLGFLFFFALFVMADCQPDFLGWSRRRPWRTSHPLKAAPRLAYGHCGYCLSVPLRLQHRPLHQPLGNLAGRFDKLDAAPRSI